MNNTERELWVLNDEGLYRWWKSERSSMNTFLRKHRSEIDEIIESAMHHQTENDK